MPNDIPHTPVHLSEAIHDCPTIGRRMGYLYFMKTWIVLLATVLAFSASAKFEPTPKAQRMAKVPVIPKFLPLPDGTKAPVVAANLLRTKSVATTRIVAPCPECPVLVNVRLDENPLDGRKVIYFEVSNLIDGHGYVVQQSSDLKNWGFVAGWAAGPANGNSGGNFPIYWPTYIRPQTFFRAIDTGMPIPTQFLNR